MVGRCQSILRNIFTALPIDENYILSSEPEKERVDKFLNKRSCTGSIMVSHFFKQHGWLLNQLPDVVTPVTLQIHHMYSTLKWLFPRRLNVEYTWFVCREDILYNVLSQTSGFTSTPLKVLPCLKRNVSTCQLELCTKCSIM